MERIKGYLPALLFACVAGVLAFAGMSSMNAKKVSHSAQSKLDSTTVAIRAELDEVRTAALEAKAIAEFGDRVIDLPEDGNIWHTTVFTTDGYASNPTEQRLLSWFQTDEQLRKLKAQTHFHHYTPSSSVYERYGNLTANGLPAIVLQDETGKVVYKASGVGTPNAPWPLVKGIVECIRAHCPHCPRPKPTPTPAPSPTPAPTPNPIPDIGPHVVPDVVGPNDNTDPNAKDDTVPVTIAVAVVFLLLGFVYAAKNSKRAGVTF